MPKRMKPEASSPTNAEDCAAMLPRPPPRVVVLALEAPNIRPSRSLRLRGRAGGRSNPRGGSGGDSMPVRGGRTGGDGISSCGGMSSSGRGLGRRQRDQKGTYLSLRLPGHKRKQLLREKARQKIMADLAAMSMRKEAPSAAGASSTATHCADVACAWLHLHPGAYHKRIMHLPDSIINGPISPHGVPSSNSTVIVQQIESDGIVALPNEPAPDPGVSMQVDPSMEPSGSDYADKAKPPVKSLEAAN